jgi:hypothetical protein
MVVRAVHCKCLGRVDTASQPMSQLAPSCTQVPGCQQSRTTTHNSGKAWALHCYRNALLVLLQALTARRQRLRCRCCCQL